MALFNRRDDNLPQPLHKTLTRTDMTLAMWIDSGAFKPKSRPRRAGTNLPQLAKQIDPIARAMRDFCLLNASDNEHIVATYNRPKQYHNLTPQLSALLPHNYTELAWEAVSLQAGDAPRLEIFFPRPSTQPTMAMMHFVVAVEPNGQVSAQFRFAGSREELLNVSLGLTTTIAALAHRPVAEYSRKAMPISPRGIASVLNRLPKYMAAVA